MNQIYRDLNSIKMPHIDIPNYDYSKLSAQEDPEARYRLVLPNKPLDRTPGEIRVTRPVIELMQR